MSPRRNIGEQPTRPRHIARVGSAVGPAQPVRETPSFAHLMSTGAVRRAVGAFAPALALAVSGLTVACADGPTAPRAPGAAAPSAAPAFNTTSDQNSKVVSQTITGDTVVTVLIVGSSSTTAKSFGIGNGDKIDFPFQASSICDLGTSSYGATEWDKPCQPSKVPVEITARSWRTAQGLPRVDFQPAMRFVPGLSKAVTLYLKDSKNNPSPLYNILFCDSFGACVDEAAADASVATQVDARNGFWIRRVKHFSGYTVVAN